jgi:hypothetical protein
VSTYVRFYALMALTLVTFFLVERGVAAVWSGHHGSYLPGLVAGAVVLTPLMVVRRKRPDVAWLYPDAPEAWATTRPTTSAGISALLVAVVAFCVALATGTAVLDGAELAALVGAFTFAVVLVMEWISHIRRRR